MVSPRFSIQVHDDRQAMGAAAAAAAASTLREAIARNGSATMVAASAPSQSEVYQNLAREPRIAWDAVTVLHMDEYFGLEPDAPQRFSNWLREAFIGQVNPGQFIAMQTEQGEDEAATRYEALLRRSQVDLVCLGIGVNGHIAFNEPPLARFDDPSMVRTVVLDQVSRQQQVADGCFGELAEVPTHALTMTIPALLAATQLVCSVPGASKATAVRALVEEPVTPQWPCTAVRRHPRCAVFLDADSASLLDGAR